KTLPEYKNPQQEPGTERRLLLVFVLTFLVIVLFQPILKKFGPQPTVETEKKTTTSTAPLPQTPPAKAGPPETKAKSQTAASKVSVQATSEAETVIDNDLYRITFTNKGGQVTSWVLKKFDDDQAQQLELVNVAASACYGQPLSLWAYDESLRSKLNSALYASSKSGHQSAPSEITFEYSDPELSVLKKFSFDHSYVVHVETTVRYKGGDIAAVSLWPPRVGGGNNPRPHAPLHTWRQ